MTLGLPVIAPSGTLAVTDRPLTAAGFVVVLPPPAAVKRTSETWRRWRPLTRTLESTVALWVPPHFEMQTTSDTLGGSGGFTPPPAAKAKPAQTDNDAPTTAAGIAGRHPRLAG